MGNIGFWEILLILLAVLILFGATKLPALARALGRSLGEFKKGREEGIRGSEPAGTEKKQDAPDNQKPANG